MTNLTKIPHRISQAEKALVQAFAEVDEIAFANQKRVLNACRTHRLTEEHFAPTTGYGLGDPGREIIDLILADIMQSEAAALRLQFVSGTHAIACSLMGNLSPGDRMVSLTGTPYDTLHPVIGLGSQLPNSLADLGISYDQISVDPAASSNEIEKQIAPLLAAPTKLVHIQKSRGYSAGRRTLSNQEIAEICRAVKAGHRKIIIMVDNCYGEFVERGEPPSCGADLIAGSLIKNPGGGLAITGGYIAGKTDFVERALSRLTAPGLAGRLGIMYGQTRLILQGLFLAPSMVANAVKSAMLWAEVFAEAGFNVQPPARERRFDIVQAIELKSAENLSRFCQAFHRASPVNAHVTPEPGWLPGYADQVIMAGGTFVQGATIELSADGPLRPPYTAYLQGALSYLHSKCVLEEVLSNLNL